MPARTTQDALALATRAPFAAALPFEPLAARFGIFHEDGETCAEDALGIPAIVSDPVPFRDGLARYREAARARAETGLSPLLVAAAAWEYLAPASVVDAATYLRAQRERFDAATADELFAGWAAEGGDPAPALHALLERFEAQLGRDPAAILHRVDRDFLIAFEAGEDDADLDEPALEGPDDPVATHARALAARRDFERRAAEQGLRARREPLRTHDEDTALAELAGSGDVHLVLLGAPPHLGLLYLGFGAFNACPPPFAHARVWELWSRRYGAEPVLVEGARVAGFLRRPCATVEELTRFHREVVLYDRDALATGDGHLPLAAWLFRNAGVDFWWD